MKRLLALLGSLVLLVAAIVAGRLFLHPPVVTIVVVNASGKSIEWAHVVHKHGWPKVEQVQPVGAIPVGQSRTVQYRSPGESEFDLKVHFADGSEVADSAGYAEAGYRFTETISDSSIRSEQKLPAY